MAIIVIFVLALVIPYIISIGFVRNILSISYIHAALDLERGVSSAFQNIIPIDIDDVTIARLIIIVLAVVIYGSLMNMKQRYRNILTKLEFKKDFETLKKQMGLSDSAKVLSPLKEKLENPMQMGKKDREQLMKLFAETKIKLDTMGRDLAFLAIDIVDSTGMKEGEEKAAIEYDFGEYKYFVEERIKKNGALKSAWTPDGVMICFTNVDAAVNCARDVINGLVDFNKTVKTMKKEFKVRCGINAGYVYFDESIPLEEMSDRVIDIAVHMQKHSAPNTISIAKPVVEPLQSRTGFVPTTKVIDNYEVYISERRKAPRE